MAGVGTERIWFYYASERQVGPMTESDLRGAIAQGLVTSNDYVYREGYKDWVLLKELPELAAGVAPSPAASERRGKSNRVPLFELVVAHNDVHVATGFIRNISTTGVFLETKDAVFNLNDEVKLTLKDGKGLGKPMHLKGVVVRQAKDTRYPVGYGVELTGVDENARVRIVEYIKRNEQVS